MPGASLAQEAPGGHLAEPVGTALTPPGGAILLDSVAAFSPIGGTATFAPATESQEIFYYSGVDPMTNELVGVVRPDAVAQPSGTFISAEVDPGLVNEQLEQLIWLPDDSGTTTVVIDDIGCSMTSNPPSLSGDYVVGDGGITCGEGAKLLTLHVCIQVRSGGVWKILNCNTKEKKDATTLYGGVAAHCYFGTWKYRTVVVGEAIGTDGDKYWGTSKSARRTFYCRPPGV